MYNEMQLLKSSIFSSLHSPHSLSPQAKFIFAPQLHSEGVTAAVTGAKLHTVDRQ